ncbi:2-hydroxyacid dehydrogenase [Dyadobacter arcticus]|uniref:D-lactate dehydrogenase n=1 Tax=Dyadobacter arcticus TaxID=1078754 RepID=A0ABX0UI52_9BACT|nr:2-hydroxyacid dehydrogenase [Dyadobacter arcticus]NIJ52698.1 D-lactate dehydrogenase [Dyadobacter arcticus]
MKVVAYSIKAFEKEPLAKANQEKHDITLISNALSLQTCHYALGKDAVLVFTNDDVSAMVINKLADQGIRYIATRSTGMDHIDKDAAGLRGIKLANVPAYSPQAIAEHALALAMALNRHLVQSNQNSHDYNFKLDGLTGFNFKDKTVGLVGLGNTGLAAASIFNGLGCHVLGNDIVYTEGLANIEQVPLSELYARSDIISLHLPLSNQTRHMIDASAIAMMKHGVMLINTSRGALIDTEDLPLALDQGQIGYLGMDVYEYEKGLFFEDHQLDLKKDSLLERLLEYPNVIITPHQAFLTQEALQQIAGQTVKNLDFWQDS